MSSARHPPSYALSASTYEADAVIRSKYINRKPHDCGECTSARSQSDRCIQSKTTWLMFIHPKFVYKQKNFPKFPSFFFFKNTPKYDKLSKISNISIKTMLELWTKFGNFGNFGNFRHISDGLRKQYSVRTQCCNLIGSEPLYIPCNADRT